MHSVCCCSLPVWRRSSLKKGTPSDLFWPALDTPQGGSGWKTTLVRDHEYFIPTKFHHNPSSGSGEEVENVKSLRRTPEGRRTDGRRAMTIAHSSLRLQWAKYYVTANSIPGALKAVYSSWSRIWDSVWNYTGPPKFELGWVELASFLFSLVLNVKCHCWWTSEYLRAHVAKLFSSVDFGW